MHTNESGHITNRVHLNAHIVYIRVYMSSDSLLIHTVSCNFLGTVFNVRIYSVHTVHIT